MSNATANPRTNRFRKVASQSLLLPPPLPLINLPDESRLARTGIQSQRPMHLPVRRHIPNPVAVAALKAKADGGPKNPEDFDHLQPPKSEPILHESRALLECEDEEYEELEVLARLHVYEYNQPDVFRDSSAPDDTLIFDSLFEGGNLQRAERIFRKTPTSGSASHMPQQEYELLIHPDIKNGAYRQWFYFEVRNGRPGLTYRFALVNLAKSGALFGQGLQPVVYSEHDAATKGVGWRHRGSHVRYDAATSPTAQPGANALTFHYRFEHENDCVYFACIQPYTYTDLMDYLEQLERDPQRSLTCRRTELCQSLAGNQCDLLTITSPAKDGIPHDERRIIVLSARVHPGEPNSSWMMQGMVDYLTGPSSGATILRRNFIFKVVPMLNPDGVINGNTRVSLAGWDLNRKWGNPIEQLFPTVYHLKQQLAHFQAHGRVAIYCDLHGHSINRNIFTYGCYTSKKRPSAPDSAKSSADAASATGPASNTVKTDPRVFPMIVARHAPCFSFASCDFSVHKSKLTTARVVVNQELGVINSYTLEASFCGPDFGTHKDTQFSTWDLEEMGRSWCQSLLVYYGLTVQVKALDAERERQAAVDERVQTSIAASSPNGRQTSRARLENGSMRMEAEDEESRLARDLLLDCEAAISALFAHSGMDISDRVGSDDDAGGGMDSDLSGAEEEPIPPSPDGRTRQRSPQIHSEREKQPDNDALVDDEGYSSAPEDFPSRKSRTSKSSHTRKKAGRRKHTRTNATKQKSAAIPTSRRGEGKSKKKKKRKSKSELRRTTLPIAASSLGPKLEDAAPCIAEEPPDIVVRSQPVDEVLKTFPKKVTTSRRSKSKSRPKSSYETPRSITSAILKATINVDLAASRASLRLRPMPEYPNTNSKLLVLPSVLDGGSRNGSVRVLKTAPSYDQEYATLEDKTRFSLARVRSELPALQNSGRDEDQQRHSRLRAQENDDFRSDEGSDSSSERSEPEAYTSSF